MSEGGSVQLGGGVLGCCTWVRVVHGCGRVHGTCDGIYMRIFMCMYPRMCC